MAKMAQDASNESFRDFARREYEERRAEARLAPAQRTCTTLDDMAGITVSDVACLGLVNVLKSFCHHPPVQRSLAQPD